MEKEKRKLPGNDRYDGRKKTARESDGKETVTEDEVEEFFTIIRRTHAAAQYYGNGNGKGNGGKMTEIGKGWTSSFEWQDFEEGNGDRDENNGERFPLEKQRKAVRVCLDLNAEPEPDAEPELEREPGCKER
eukprot:TRINITY_DN22513_c0_g1_i1.p1 TRINITY_DN22513_c0_g1~~TRINITY_DN22513_c0_g1_i1.p1  ORF type:complete len:132 (+),score=18.04 TRINITY_DN22513_c0_g1_i1:77-472(+)